MKTILRTTAIVGSLMLAIGSFAQDKAMPAAHEHSMKATEGRTGGPVDVEKMTKDLGLSADQSAKLKEISGNAGKEMASMKEMKPEERAAKEKELKASCDKQVEGVLTPEQNKKWMEMKQSAEKARMMKHEEAAPKKAK